MPHQSTLIEVWLCVKFLSRRAHGILDYAVVVAFLSIPMAFGFTGAPRTLAYSFAFLHLLVTGLSKFPPGGIALLKYRVHAAVEAVAGLSLIAAPWILRFADIPAARNSFLIIAALLLVMSAFTDFDRRRQAVPPPPGDRRRWYSRRSG